MNAQPDGRLRHLRLSGMAEALPGRLQQAVAAGLPHQEFLELLVEDKLARRADRLFARRLKQAGISQVKEFTEFEATAHAEDRACAARLESQDSRIAAFMCCATRSARISL